MAKRRSRHTYSGEKGSKRRTPQDPHWFDPGEIVEWTDQGVADLHSVENNQKIFNFQLPPRDLEDGMSLAEPERFLVVGFGDESGDRRWDHVVIESLNDRTDRRYVFRKKIIRPEDRR